MMSTRKGGREWVLKIPVFVDSAVFKQQFYCSFLLIRGGCCTIGCFLWMSDPLRCLKDQLYAVPHPDVFWYHLNGMGVQKNTPKKVLVTLFLYIFHVKTKFNIAGLRKLKNKNLFKRHKYSSPNVLNIRYFGALSYNHWGSLGITKLFNP